MHLDGFGQQLIAETSNEVEISTGYAWDIFQNDDLLRWPPIHKLWPSIAKIQSQNLEIDPFFHDGAGAIERFQ